MPLHRMVRLRLQVLVRASFNAPFSAPFGAPFGVLLWLAIFSTSHAADKVWFQPPPTSSGDSQWLPQSLQLQSGQITEVDSDTLRIQPAQGDLVHVAIERIIWLEPDWKNPAAQEGMSLFAEEKFGEAIPKLFEAVQAGPPTWQQQWLTGHLMWAATESERYPAALELLAQLAKSKPPTPVLGLLPIRWTARPASPTAIEAARSAIDHDEALVRLVAASWLLSDSASRELAERTLDALSNDRSQAWLGALATAVRWRRTPVPQIEKLSDRWLESINRMPISLQRGPLLCVADRLQAAGAKERANDLTLTVSLLYKKPIPTPRIDP